MARTKVPEVQEPYLITTWDMPESIFITQIIQSSTEIIKDGTLLGQKGPISSKEHAIQLQSSSF